MRIVVDSEPEMVGRWLMWLLDDILTAAKQLHDAQRYVGKSIRVGAALLQQPLLECARIGR